MCRAARAAQRAVPHRLLTIVANRSAQRRVGKGLVGIGKVPAGRRGGGRGRRGQSKAGSSAGTDWFGKGWVGLSGAQAVHATRPLDAAPRGAGTPADTHTTHFMLLAAVMLSARGQGVASGTPGLTRWQRRQRPPPGSKHAVPAKRSGGGGARQGGRGDGQQLCPWLLRPAAHGRHGNTLPLAPKPSRAAKFCQSPPRGGAHRQWQ